MSHASANRSTRLLALGAILGALLAASGLVERQLSGLEMQLVASVNGEAIYLASYQAYLEALERDRQQALGDAERQQVLERLIEERLLIQRAIETGLVRSDPGLRKAIVDAIVENILAGSPQSSPDTDALRTFYEENRAYFSSPPLLQVQRMVFRGPDAADRAGRARSSLDAGEPFAVVEGELADAEILPLPGSPLPANRLANYLGPTLAQQMAELDVGAISGPHRREESLSLLRLAGASPGRAPLLEDIRDQVLREYQRRANEQALREYLDELREQADIRRASTLPGAAPGGATR